MYRTKDLHGLQDQISIFIIACDESCQYIEVPKDLASSFEKKTHPKINHEIFPDLPCSTFVFFRYLAAMFNKITQPFGCKILRSDSTGKAWVNHARISKKSAFGISKKRKGMTIISCLNSFLSNNTVVEEILHHLGCIKPCK